MSDDLKRAPTRNEWADIANQSADRIRDLELQLKQANDAAFNEGVEAAVKKLGSMEAFFQSQADDCPPSRKAEWNEQAYAFGRAIEVISQLKRT
jgi:hypothetical protein